LAISDDIRDREFGKFRGTFPGRERVAIEDDATFYKREVRVNANLTYIGENRNQGAATTSLTWRVSRVLTSGGVTETLYAGSGSFEHPFNDPASLFPAVSLINAYSTDFDGINDVANGGNIVNFDAANQFSISMWVKPDNTAAQRALFSKTTNDGNVFGFVLYHNSSAQPFLQMRSSGNLRQHTFANFTFVNQVWQHIVFTYSGSANISGARFYYNGQVSDTPASGPLTSWLSGQDFTVGARNTTQNFSGRIDHIFVINKALDQSEVTELYNNGSPVDPSVMSFTTNILNWWRMGDGDTFPVIADNRGANDLTMINMTASDFVLDVP